MRISLILMIFLLIQTNLPGWNVRELTLKQILLVDGKPDCCLIENNKTKIAEYFRPKDYLNDVNNWKLIRILKDRVEIGNGHQVSVLYLSSSTSKSIYSSNIDKIKREEAYRAQIRSKLDEYRKNYVDHPKFIKLRDSADSLIQSVCTQIEKRLGIYLPENVVVYIIGDDSIFGERVAGNYAGEAQIKYENGKITGKILLNIKEYCDSDSFNIRETLAHELAHIFIASLPEGHKTPRFVHEGLANYASADDNTEYLEKNLAGYIAGKKIWARGVGDIIRPFNNLFEEEFYLIQDYLAVHLMALYLVEEKGIDSIAHWVEKFSIKKQNALDSLIETAGFIDEDSFRKDLERFSKKKIDDCFAKSPLIHYYMGNYYMREKEYVKARESFLRAISTNKDHAPSHAGMVSALSYLAKKNPDNVKVYRNKALEHAKKAVKINPENEMYNKMLDSFQ